MPQMGSRDLNQRASAAHKEAMADLYNPDLVRVTMSIGGGGARKLSGTVHILLHKSWAPLGVAHLEKMLHSQVYDGTKFFRCVPNFIIQFGIPANPTVTRRWSDTIKDDPSKIGVENRRGTVVFATSGANSRTTQLFVNLVENGNRLDSKEYVPVGEVISGMDILDGVYFGYGETPDQDRIRVEGDEYLKLKYSQMSMVQWARIDKKPFQPQHKNNNEAEKEEKETDSASSESAIKQWAAKQVKNEQSKQLIPVLGSVPRGSLKVAEKAKYKVHVLQDVAPPNNNVIDRVRRSEAVKKERNLRKSLPKSNGIRRGRGHDGVIFVGGIFCSIFVFVIYVRCCRNRFQTQIYKRTKQRTI